MIKGTRFFSRRLLPLLLAAVMLLGMLPALTLLAVYIIYPIISTLILSFQTWKGIYGAPKEFAGFANYLKVLKSDTFWNALLNSFYFMVGTFLVLMPLSFGLALLVTSKLKFTGFMKTMYYIPVILGTTTVALMWKCILNPNTGVLAGIMHAIGLGDSIHDWLNTAPENVWVTVLINEWKYAGYNMLIFIAGITSIPQTTFEAAKIDGASRWQTLWKVTIPNVMPSITICTFLSLTNGFKLFDQNLALTGGQPYTILPDGSSIKTTEMLALNILNTFYGQNANSRGTAQAKAVLFFILVASIGLLQLRSNRKKEVQQ